MRFPLLTAVGLLCSCFLLPASGVRAAEETEVVDFLHANVEAAFYGQFLQGEYRLDGNYVGAREEERQLVPFKARFGAFYDLEVSLATYFTTWDRVRWENINFGGTPPVNGDEQTERRRGFGDLTFGARYAILNANRRPEDLSNWTVGIDFTAPTGRWTPYPVTQNRVVDNSGVKPSGVGGGGADWRFYTSFSRRFGRFDPYATFFMQTRGNRRLTGGQTYKPGNEFGTFFGLELVGFERKSDGLKFAADLGVGWTWINEGGTHSNRFLYGPDTQAPSTPGEGSVLEEGHADVAVRWGFAYQVHQYLRVRGYAWFDHPGAHFIEKYDASFADPLSGGQIQQRKFTDFSYTFELVFTY